MSDSNKDQPKKVQHCTVNRPDSRYIRVQRMKGFLEAQLYQKSPRARLGICDVRDLADALIFAAPAFNPNAAGNRHIIASEVNLIPWVKVVDILYDEFYSKGYTKIPRKEAAEGWCLRAISDWTIRG